MSRGRPGGRRERRDLGLPGHQAGLARERDVGELAPQLQFAVRFGVLSEMYLRPTQLGHGEVEFADPCALDDDDLPQYDARLEEREKVGRPAGRHKMPLRPVLLPEGDLLYVGDLPLVKDGPPALVDRDRFHGFQVSLVMGDGVTFFRLEPPQPIAGRRAVMARDHEHTVGEPEPAAVEYLRPQQNSPVKLEEALRPARRVRERELVLASADEGDRRGEGLQSVPELLPD